MVEKSERFGGEVYAPPSKAYTHRMMIGALLSRGTSRILNPLSSDDTQATLEAIEAFGAEVEPEETCWTIKGRPSLETPRNPIDCGESGATLRFMIPVATLAPGPSTFTLGLSISRRPLEPLLRSLKQLGAESSLRRDEKGSVVRVHGGGIRGGKASIRGDISSQFISGLLFVCPRAEENTEITVTTPLESVSYVRMTIEVLEKHGIRVSASNDLKQLRVPSNQNYSPCDHKVPGDFSSASFLLAAAAITCSKVKVKNLDQHTTQGDKAILGILEEMGSKVRVEDEYVEAEGKQLNAIDVDVKDIPDLVPVCAALACYSKGTSKLYNARRLRYKESDRLSSLHAELKKMGADVKMIEDCLIIKGPRPLHGATIDPHNDHRIAMACAVAALGASGDTRIQNSECVRKSYPTFFDDLRSLGADVVGE
ncbi:MAG: 3-phosphoshikimate 1-carboxyvinyltransferase [Candidatus Bathyarchaeota archaeon]|nr:3-phosphoshikimate 1-carboxyvinyltransferase [Candidatus Bathyarchaeota archaeon]MDH5531878.1 3-phosphoshikimate 1-carboxyvinyltransferase [Candidatus Bathyarchaeota archaeon]MDH5712745.1 3-phosphoshikimate 1-carboxyvinyltransferase [Candidatus Bathyarchaeota archaeon]